jgi:hypothetical protein
MAQNLQSKSDPSDNIIVYDVVRGAADKLVGSNIVMANSVTEVAEHAVSRSRFIYKKKNNFENVHRFLTGLVGCCDHNVT